MTKNTPDTILLINENDEYVVAVKENAKEREKSFYLARLTTTNADACEGQTTRNPFGIQHCKPREGAVEIIGEEPLTRFRNGRATSLHLPEDVGDDVLFQAFETIILAMLDESKDVAGVVSLQCTGVCGSLENRECIKHCIRTSAKAVAFLIVVNKGRVPMQSWVN